MGYILYANGDRTLSHISWWDISIVVGIPEVGEKVGVDCWVNLEHLQMIRSY